MHLKCVLENSKEAPRQQWEQCSKYFVLVGTHIELERGGEGLHLMEAICAIPRRCHYSPYFFPSTRAPLVFVRETPLRTGALQYEPVCSLWEIERPPSSPVQKNMCTRIASNAGFFFFRVVVLGRPSILPTGSYVTEYPSDKAGKEPP